MVWIFEINFEKFDSFPLTHLARNTLINTNFNLLSGIMKNYRFSGGGIKNGKIILPSLNYCNLKNIRGNRLLTNDHVLNVLHYKVIVKSSFIFLDDHIRIVLEWFKF